MSLRLGAFLSTVKGLPMASSFGQSFCAVAWLTIATAASDSASCLPNVRPRRDRDFQNFEIFRRHHVVSGPHRLRALRGRHRNLIVGLVKRRMPGRRH